MDTIHLCYHPAQHRHKKESPPVRLNSSRLRTGIDRRCVIMGSFAMALRPCYTGHASSTAYLLSTAYIGSPQQLQTSYGVQGHRLPDSPSVLTVCVNRNFWSFP